MLNILYIGCQSAGIDISANLAYKSPSQKEPMNPETLAKNNHRRLAAHIVERKWQFLGSFAMVFFVSFSLLGVFDIVPERISRDNSGNAQAADEEMTDSGAPLRVVIESVGIDAKVVNPASRDIQVLDEALREGVVHYPGSGALTDNSNVFLFGHSSYLPKVQNKAYQAFNNLQKVKIGDIVQVESEGRVYEYSVVSVSLAQASEALVELSEGKKRLTLSTCNSFGAKTERFVVEADFVGSSPLTQGA